ncbi:hypothetical protein ACOCG7_08475 [Paraburkholderia sp. DD10]|jgi:hypothetical protein|uniref:hypothetical protein n=1 Tax=Paraburkholderia sp. DD10 TaxID=3409691 RepID=UPI003BA0923A
METLKSLPRLTIEFNHRKCFLITSFSSAVQGVSHAKARRMKRGKPFNAPLGALCAAPHGRRIYCGRMTPRVKNAMRVSSYQKHDRSAPRVYSRSRRKAQLPVNAPITGKCAVDKCTLFKTRDYPALHR